MDHAGVVVNGVPNIYGMNFQSVSTAQKLPNLISSVVTGGYLADGNTPGPLLSGALKYVDNQLSLIVAAIAASPNNGSTVIVITAKHGQSPKLPSALLRIDNSLFEAALNAAWKKKTNVSNLIYLTASDDGLQYWLKDRSTKATSFAKKFLMSYSGVGTTISPPYTTKAYNSSGLVAAYAGVEACNFYNVRCPDGRVPDLVGISAYGVIYTSGTKKISEHGGFNTDDRNVPLIVSGASLPAGNAGVISTSNVFTIQVAPTILSLLGLDPFRLAAVQMEKTAVLPMAYTAQTIATATTIKTNNAYVGRSLAASVAGLSLTMSAFFFL